MAQRDVNIRDRRRNEGSGRAVVYVVCVIILLICVILDILFIKGIMP